MESFSELVLQKVKKTTRQMVCSDGEVGQVAVTKLGGVPFWPAGLERPKCEKGHFMTFYAQILLADVPSCDPQDQTLLSFHWCDACAREGDSDFGARHEIEGGRGYQVTLFADAPSLKPDGRGLVSEVRIPPRRVALEDAEELPEYFEFEELAETLPPFPEVEDEPYEALEAESGLENIEADKLGGWPSWVQHVDWLDCPHGKRYQFVGQLGTDEAIADEGPWAAGGFGYFYVCSPDCPERTAEMDSQFT